MYVGVGVNFCSPNGDICEGASILLSEPRYKVAYYSNFRKIPMCFDTTSQNDGVGQIPRIWVRGPLRLRWKLSQKMFSTTHRHAACLSQPAPQLKTAATSAPQLPFRMPQIASNRDHKALDKDALGAAALVEV